MYFSTNIGKTTPIRENSDSDLNPHTVNKKYESTLLIHNDTLEGVKKPKAKQTYTSKDYVWIGGRRWKSGMEWSGIILKNKQWNRLGSDGKPIPSNPIIFSRFPSSPNLQWNGKYFSPST